MKYSTLLMTTSLCAVTALPALAQGRPFDEVDLDGNRSLSQSELAVVFGSDGAERILTRNDINGDGVLTKEELRVSRNDDESDDENDDSDEDDDEDDDKNGDEGDENDESSDEDSDESDDDDEDSDESSDEDDGDDGDDGESSSDEDDGD